MIEPELDRLAEGPRPLPFSLVLAALRGRFWWVGWLFFALGLLGAGLFLDVDGARWGSRPASRATWALVRRLGRNGR